MLFHPPVRQRQIRKQEEDSFQDSRIPFLFYVLPGKSFNVDSRLSAKEGGRAALLFTSHLRREAGMSEMAGGGGGAKKRRRRSGKRRKQNVFFEGERERRRRRRFFPYALKATSHARKGGGRGAYIFLP